MKSEKITVNLTPTELAQIDYLVDKGMYVGRSDFIRLAIRKQVEAHQSDFDQFTKFSNEMVTDNIRPSVAIGILSLGEYALQSYIIKGEKLNINVIGVLSFKDDVTIELLEKAVANIKVHGKIIAKDEVKAYINKKFFG